MSANAHDVSQETSQNEADIRFLQAWKDGVEIAGPGLFGCQVNSPQNASHWRQLAPKLIEKRRHIPNKSQSQGAFAAAMACFFNAAEGHKLLKKSRLRILR